MPNIGKVKVKLESKCFRKRLRKDKMLFRLVDVYNIIYFIFNLFVFRQVFVIIREVISQIMCPEKQLSLRFAPSHDSNQLRGASVMFCLLCIHVNL